MYIIYLITGLTFSVYLAAGWAAGKYLGLSQSEFYILFGLVTAVGTLAAAAFVWWKMRQAESAAEEADDPAAEEVAGSDEIDILIRDAETKLAAAKLAQGSRIGNLPLIFILGDQGTTKTSVVTHSGLEPELLAGQVYQDNNIAPTRIGNLWFARNTILAEVTPRVLSDRSQWERAVKRLRPRTLKSVVGGNAQAPRAALVCVNSEIFTQPGAQDALTGMARNLQARLGEISEALGISFPVYVLFTRADRLPFFAEYVRTLTNEESGQVLGVTMPMRTLSGGVYAEEENQRLSNAFNGLFHSLADHRIEFLPRESEQDKVPGAYEFPREFRKIRGPLVQFLVDLCRPSQLRTSPFLRGFYFCGVRPVTVQEVAPPRPSAPLARAEHAGTATGVFHLPSHQPQAAASQQQFVGTKRVPQWLFITRLFNNIILQDHAALSASGASTKTSTLQRVLLAIAALACLVVATGFTVSFFNNRSLVHEANTAAEAVSNRVDLANSGPASGDLQKLDDLRNVLVKLNNYRVNGRPLSMGWGLYAGDDLYPTVRRSYYRRFSELLFADAQGALESHMEKLPATPGATDDYRLSYDVLKGYLITTSHSDKVSEESPAPILMRKWTEARNVQDARKDIAWRHFEFYAADLKNGNPFPTTNDRDLVERTRDYLNQFSGIERVYAYMLSLAGKKSVNFNRDIPGSAQAVLNNKEVPAAFTKDGYAFMQKALPEAYKYFGGEPWVLERTRSEDLDRAKLTADLSQRYVTDFVAQWRAYFKNSAVLRYTGLADAAQKLNLQTGTQSPILGLFWLAAQHTGVDTTKIQGADAIKKAFQPVHRVVPPGNADRYASDKNQGYTNGLMGLQQSLDAAKATPTPDAASIIGAAGNAKMAVKQMALEFDIDQEARLNATVQKLLEDPITSAEDLVKTLGPRELNGKGKALCDVFGPVTRKFPFNPASQAEATVAELNALLKPGEGLLWTFYEANLKKGLLKVGTEYRPTGEIEFNPAFLNFFNNASRLSEALYRSGPDPRITYTVRPLRSDGIQNLALILDGQTLEATATAGKQFTWPGTAQGSRFTGKVGTSDLPSAQYDGLWSAFRLFLDAEKVEPAGSGYNLEWVLQLKFGRSTSSAANAPTARFFVDLGPANFLLRKGGLSCVSQVAR